VHPNYLEKYFDLIRHLHRLEIKLLSLVAEAGPDISTVKLIDIVGEPWWIQKSS
jgi:hypothetical protein